MSRAKDFPAKKKKIEVNMFSQEKMNPLLVFIYQKDHPILTKLIPNVFYWLSEISSGSRPSRL